MTAESTFTNSASQWSRPSSRPDHIEQLISGVDRYNPQNLQVLTEYLDQQLQTGEYDCLANLAILKLFQFNPQDFEYSIVISILLKAMTAAPFPDFNLCLSLLGEAPISSIPSNPPNFSEDITEEQKLEIQKQFSETANQPSAGILIDPLIVKLSILSSNLLSAKFRLFWKQFESSDFAEVKEFTKGISNFQNSVRKVALENVKVSFRTISLTRLSDYLNLNSNEVKSFLSNHQGWQIQGENVLVPSNPDNDIKATVIREDVQLDQLTRLLSQSQST